MSDASPATLPLRPAPKPASTNQSGSRPFKASPTLMGVDQLFTLTSRSPSRPAVSAFLAEGLKPEPDLAPPDVTRGGELSESSAPPEHQSRREPENAEVPPDGPRGDVE